jgi:sec-independent protein translocase protein TatA
MEFGSIFAFMGLGGQEIFLVALFILLFFGAKKIPELMRGLGQGINEFKNATKDVKENIEKGMEDSSTTKN